LQVQGGNEVIIARFFESSLKGFINRFLNGHIRYFQFLS
jgi:hypothetical protein